MDKLKGAKYFSKFDVQWGYNNVQIRSGDEWKAAFKMNRGLYEPTVMFFGMCNSLATFQAMMDEIFKKEIEENLIIVYMDDILAFSKTLMASRKLNK
jgi:Reverse transcriptase (RNA-dependent DNA polymerase)